VIGVVKRGDGGPLTEADTQRVQRLATQLGGAGIERLAAAQTAPQAVSPNRSVQLVTVALQGTSQDEAVVDALGEVRERSRAALEGAGCASAGPATSPCSPTASRPSPTPSGSSASPPSC
jgi:RND superfamily putative drug exporter